MLSGSFVTAILPAADLERAKKFYGEALGLKETMSMQGVVMYGAGQGSQFVVYAKPDGTKADHTVMGFMVGDLDAEMRVLGEKGVTFEEYDIPNLKTVNGVMDYGAVRTAWFKDSEGNIIA